jgi:hypothetical protein
VVGLVSRRQQALLAPDELLHLLLTHCAQSRLPRLLVLVLVFTPVALAPASPQWRVRSGSARLLPTARLRCIASHARLSRSGWCGFRSSKRVIGGGRRRNGIDTALGGRLRCSRLEGSLAIVHFEREARALPALTQRSRPRSAEASASETGPAFTPSVHAGRSPSTQRRFFTRLSPRFFLLSASPVVDGWEGLLLCGVGRGNRLPPPLEDWLGSTRRVGDVFYCKLWSTRA